MKSMMYSSLEDYHLLRLKSTCWIGKHIPIPSWAAHQNTSNKYVGLPTWAEKEKKHFLYWAAMQSPLKEATNVRQMTFLAIQISAERAEQETGSGLNTLRKRKDVSLSECCKNAQSNIVVSPSTLVWWSVVFRFLSPSRVRSGEAAEDWQNPIPSPEPPLLLGKIWV